MWVEHTRAGCPSERGPSLKGTPLSPRGARLRALLETMESEWLATAHPKFGSGIVTAIHHCRSMRDGRGMNPLRIYLFRLEAPHPS